MWHFNSRRWCFFSFYTLLKQRKSRNWRKLIFSESKKVTCAGSLWVSMTNHASSEPLQRTHFGFEGPFSAFSPFPRVTCCLEPSRITHIQRSQHAEHVYAHTLPAPRQLQPNKSMEIMPHQSAAVVSFWHFHKAAPAFLDFIFTLPFTV